MLTMIAIPQTAKFTINCYQNSIALDVYTCIEIGTQKGKDLPVYTYQGEKSNRVVRLHCHKLLTSKNADQLLKGNVPAFQAEFSYDKETDTFVINQSSVKFQEAVVEDVAA